MVTPRVRRCLVAVREGFAGGLRLEKALGGDDDEGTLVGFHQLAGLDLDGLLLGADRAVARRETHRMVGRARMFMIEGGVGWNLDRKGSFSIPATKKNVTFGDRGTPRVTLF